MASQCYQNPLFLTQQTKKKKKKKKKTELNIDIDGVVKFSDGEFSDLDQIEPPPDLSPRLGHTL